MQQGSLRKWIFAGSLSFFFIGLMVFMLVKIYHTDMTVVATQQETPEAKFKELISRLANTGDVLVIVNMNFEDTLDTVLKGTKLLHGSDYKVDRSRKVMIGKNATSVITLGGTILNNNMAFINRLNEIFKIDVSICVREDENFIRVASSLTDTNGKSGVGTIVNKKNIAYKFVDAGESYTGRTNLLGKDYYAKYEPIIIDGKVEGLFMVGVSYETFISQLYSVLMGGGMNFSEDMK